MSMNVKIITLYTLIVIVQSYFSSDALFIVWCTDRLLWKEYFIIIALIAIMYLSVTRPHTTEISETDKVKYTGKPFKSGIIGAEAC